jgi:hypothetical protein
MRLKREKPAATQGINLPGRGETVTLRISATESVPAKVAAREPAALLVALMLPRTPLSRSELDGLVLEFNDPRGRVRLQGTVSIEDPREPDVLRIDGPRSIEVLQEREYVRIRSARPVLVYCGSDQLQVQSYTVDVSGGGLLLAGPDTLKIGEEISFRLSTATGETPIVGTGKVVRSDPQGRRAVAFHEISDLDRRRLVRFIFDCQRAERRRGLEDDRYGS